MTNCTNARDVWDIVTDIQMIDWDGIAYLLDLVMQDIPGNSKPEHLVKVQDGLWQLINCIKNQAKEQDKFTNELNQKVQSSRKS